MLRAFRAQRALPALLALVLLAAPAPAAQRRDEPEEVPAVDPYTEGAPEALARRGYVSFGPFPVGDRHDTTETQRVLGGMPMLWVETAHFRLGSTLEPYTLAPDPLERRKVRAELERLAETLPGVKPRARELDRWLLLHLWAQRCEELWSELQSATGVTDADFAPGGALHGGPGSGPYVGQREKTVVLLLQKESELGRYCGHFLSARPALAQRWYWHGLGTMLVATAFEGYLGTYANDTAVHCALANNLAQSFVDAFRAFTCPTPEWLRHGLGHVVSRRVDERYSVFGGGLGTHGQKDDGWRWAPRVRGLVEHEHWPSWEKMIGWASFEDLSDAGHRIAWSRVQFLVQRPEAMRRFLVELKATAQGAGCEDVLRERQRKHLPAAWEVADLEELTAAWAAWVEETYPTR